jgi:hypothetical protein
MKGQSERSGFREEEREQQPAQKLKPQQLYTRSDPNHFKNKDYGRAK